MSENDKLLRDKVSSAMYTIIKEKGVVSTVDVLMAIDVLSKSDYESWRHGKTDYLERVCKVNLRKLSVIAQEIRVYAKQHNLKPSWTDYRRWGKGENTKLRFSKSGDEQIERSYATHYVSQSKVDAAAADKAIR